jgi:hypothetical protein
MHKGYVARLREQEARAKYERLRARATRTTARRACLRAWQAHTDAVVAKRAASLPQVWRGLGWGELVALARREVLR